MSKSRKVLGKILQAEQHLTPERTVVQKNQLYPPQEEEFPKKNKSESKVTELLQPAATLSGAILEFMAEITYPVLTKEDTPFMSMHMHYIKRGATKHTYFIDTIDLIFLKMYLIFS
ncbi:hypothetical protein XENOCAPTIV_020560 [Xenoophorus captivus]|uniref:Uncharacterized protein n=1 Tax=Xenoophorus captivus TaxID=1517983 RepID=A0ABV0QKG2_9TELE